MWFYHSALVFHLCIPLALCGAAAPLMSQWDRVPLRDWYSCWGPWSAQSNHRRLKITTWSLYFLQKCPILVAISLLLGFVATCSWKCFVYSYTLQFFQKIKEIWCFLRKNILRAARGYDGLWCSCLQPVWFCFWCRTPIPFYQCVCLFCWDFIAFKTEAHHMFW